MRMPVVTAADYVPRLASEKGVSGETEAKAIEILESARKCGLISGKVPISIAAAAICLAARITDDKQAQKIKGFADVPESAIRTRFEELTRELGKRDLLRMPVHMQSLAGFSLG